MTSVMKSLMIVLMTLLAIVHAQVAEAQMTREQAIAILIQQVIEPSPNKDDLMAFGPQNMLQPGDVVRPHRIGVPSPGQPKTIESPTWFFFVNDEVMAGYVHPTRFVYIDANHPNPTVGDGISVNIQGWWPVINEQAYYDSQYPKEHPDWVYGEMPPVFQNLLEEFLIKKAISDEAFPVPLQGASVNPNHGAIIVSGYAGASYRNGIKDVKRLSIRVVAANYDEL